MKGPSEVTATLSPGFPRQAGSRLPLGHRRAKNRHFLNDAHRGDQHQVAERHIHQAMPQ